MFVQQFKKSTRLLLRVAIVIGIALVLGTTTMSSGARQPIHRGHSHHPLSNLTIAGYRRATGSGSTRPIFHRL
jgi:hypothetical protein